MECRFDFDQKEVLCYDLVYPRMAPMRLETPEKNYPVPNAYLNSFLHTLVSTYIKRKRSIVNIFLTNNLS